MEIVVIYDVVRLISDSSRVRFLYGWRWTSDMGLLRYSVIT